MQELIVFIVIAVVIFFVGRNIMQSFKALNKGENPCSTCMSDCKIKEVQKEKQQNCNKTAKSKEKSEVNI